MSTFYCFEVCSSDLALAVSRFCTVVSVSDNLWLPLVSAVLVSRYEQYEPRTVSEDCCSWLCG